MPKPNKEGGIACPYCNHPHNRVVWKMMPTQLPKHLLSLNIMRRGLRCLKCGSDFKTVEMLEDDFEDLKRPARPGLRPVELSGR